MNPEVLASEINASLMATVALGGPLLAIAAGIGFVFSFVQAVTQLQDQTLTLIVKITAVSFVIVAAGAALATPIYQQTLHLFAAFPSIVR